ncbi:hypothetical protein [Bradymonas sediminis]|uniref:Uncharacterized protein n=1 Tax=Bradymonas sediminis TaxID=1548548 RepID=A0A2Z4FGV6_9DELT|nr:hypothetical protein [Bradymonas sediminis]AWV88231.1 hypothetical protein DN745_02300 [Bradymonas sediminis]TDP77354.1 hypothetical protein DFR33_101254 [Bradymonas sediminis]
MQHLHPNPSALFTRLNRGRVALLLALLALLVGCGAQPAANMSKEDSDFNNVEVERQEDAGTYDDASTGGSYDTSQEFDASYDFDAGAYDDASGPTEGAPGYNPDLDPVAGPLPECRTEPVGPQANGRLGARVFVPSYRLDLSALSSHQSFRAHIHQLIRDEVLPCTPEEAASLVVFPEAMSLPMLLIGPKAAAARQMDDASRALSSMIAAVPNAYAFYGEKYPDTSTNARFALAMTDPLVRATYDTFGQLAAHYQLYISVTVTLPAFKRVEDPERVPRLADPDIVEPLYAYEAESAEIYTRQLIFSPDGELLDETLKSYVNPMGRQQLGLSDARVGSLHTFESPWGASAVAISDAALMPDIQDRLDDLGARVLLQPNAQRGSWAGAPSTTNDADDALAPIWQPDRFMLGAYNLVQRSPRMTRGYVPQITGDFFELYFDGQVQMVGDAHHSPQGAAFIGQDSAAAGNFFVGPWVVEDPAVAHPEWSTEERRAALRATGERLAPGASDPLDISGVEGVWANDLPAPPDTAPAVETHPAIVAVADRIYVAASQGRIGERGLRMQVLHSNSDAWSTDESAPTPLADLSISVPDYDLIRPTMAAKEDHLHIVAELIGDDENRLVYLNFDREQNRFVGEPKIIDAQFVGPRAYHPDLKISGDVLNMTWVQEINGVNRAVFAQTNLNAPFESLSVRTEIDRRADETMALPGNMQGANGQAPASQWDARLAVTQGAIAVTWMNYRDSNWEILASASVDGGLSWSRAIRVDAVPQGVQAFNASPTIAAISRRSFALAWTDARATRPNTRVAAAMLTVTSDGQIHMPRPATLLDAGLLGAPGQHDDLEASTGQTDWHWRPVIIPETLYFSVYYEALSGARRSIKRTRIERTTATQLITDTVANDTGAGGYFPSVTSNNGAAFVAFEELDTLESRGSKTRVMRAGD